MAVQRLLAWYLHAAEALCRTFGPDTWHVPLGPPPPACTPPAFSTHHQALQWASGEHANLIPVLGMATTADSDISWKFPVALLAVFSLQRRSVNLIAPLNSALGRTRLLGDRAAEAWVLRALAEVHLENGRPAQAAQYSHRAQAAFAETGDSHGQWAVTLFEGTAYLDLGRLGDALDCLGQALAKARQCSDPWAEGVSLDRLAVVNRLLGSFGVAIDLHMKALAILSDTDSRWQQAYAVRRLADTYRLRGCIDDAVNQYQHARTAFREIGDYWAEADLLLDLGQAQIARGRVDEARQSWQSALTTFEEFGDVRASQVREQLQELGA